jgi:hypothetical protein
MKRCQCGGGWKRWNAQIADHTDTCPFPLHDVPDTLAGMARLQRWERERDELKRKAQIVPPELRDSWGAPLSFTRHPVEEG